MTNNNFQYNSCVSKGICSINPRTYALQRVLILYLILISKYFYELYKKGIESERGKELILNTIAITVSNPEFTENSFIMSVERFKEILPKVIEKYNSFCKENELRNLEEESLHLLEESNDLNHAIRMGEKDMQKFQNYSEKTRDLLRILLSVVKSISINLLDLESFEESDSKGFEIILKAFNMFISPDEELIKEHILLASNLDKQLMIQLRKIQEENYGKQREKEVSYSTTPSKAVLVVGSNIRELENVLDSLENTNIDIYTHDDMMLAHTFPKFSDYKNLKGQYGQGLENCLIDFATFPGPIILTKHSLHNIENFYRGRLFTTDYTSPKGVIKIENNDFSEVIQSANNAKGFKTGKQCESVLVGYEFEKTIQEIFQIIENNNYKHIIIIGLEQSQLQNTYFEKLVKLIPNDTLIVSLSYKHEAKNFYHINTCFDTVALIKLYEKLKQLKLPISIIIPKCNRNSISQMIYFSNQENTRVFVGICTPIILNPTILNTLNNTFGINQITSARDDIDKILL